MRSNLLRQAARSMDLKFIQNHAHIVAAEKPALNFCRHKTYNTIAIRYESDRTYHTDYQLRTSDIVSLWAMILEQPTGYYADNLEVLVYIDAHHLPILTMLRCQDNCMFIFNGQANESPICWTHHHLRVHQSPTYWERASSLGRDWDLLIVDRKPFLNIARPNNLPPNLASFTDCQIVTDRYKVYGIVLWAGNGPRFLAKPDTSWAAGSIYY